MGSSAPIFPVLEEDMASYVAGLWQGYADAIKERLKGPWNTLSAIGDNWQGRRADLFNRWWGPASVDVNNLFTVAQMMADGFNQFARRVPDINSLIVQMSSLVLSNTKPGLPGHYTFTVDDPNFKNDTFSIIISGFVIEGPIGPGVDRPTPSWLSRLLQLRVKVQEEYDAAANAAAATISSAPAMLRQMTQLTEISRSSGALQSVGPFASLNDPTWKLLTGGGVFRPTLPPGFHGDPFSGRDLPSWYRPTTGQQIVNWIGDHAGDIVDVTSLLLALAGNPELSGMLELTYGAYEDGTAIADHDWGEAGIDTLGLVVSVAGLGVGGETAEQLADDASLGHGFSAAVQSALHDSDGAIPPTVAEHFGDYVQDEVEDYIRQQITESLKNGGAPPTTVTVPASVLNQIMSQAAENMGQNTGLYAAGLPPTN